MPGQHCLLLMLSRFWQFLQLLVSDCGIFLAADRPTGLQIMLDQRSKAILAPGRVNLERLQQWNEAHGRRGHTREEFEEWFQQTRHADIYIHAALLTC